MHIEEETKAKRERKEKQEMWGKVGLSKMRRVGAPYVCI